MDGHVIPDIRVPDPLATHRARHHGSVIVDTLVMREVCFRFERLSADIAGQLGQRRGVRVGDAHVLRDRRPIHDAATQLAHHGLRQELLAVNGS